jgi:2-keto-4-pentenoate hydratase/2-oxohepta-3-ene-1,7-dioic acid hydratase in catechol pathway
VKLVSFRVPTSVGPVARIGAVDSEGRYVDLQSAYRGHLVDRGVTPDAALRIAAALAPSDMVAFIEGGDASLQAARDALAWAAVGGSADGSVGQVHYDPAEVTTLAPIPRPPLLRDFMAFETHLKNIYPRLGREIPPEWYNFPVYYKGNAGSIGTHGEDVPIPPYADELDYEFELGMVIGKGGIDISRERALDHVFGFMIYDDFSARAFQAREMSVGLGPAKGKDFANAHVFGPWLVTKDEIPDIYDLRMVCRVNGEVRCDDSSGTMHWRFEDLIAHASTAERIVPGEIFGSGTVGNGSGAEIGRSLKPGDVVELEVTGLGLLRNRVVAGPRSV